MPPTIPVHVRIDAENLRKLEEIGKNAKPKALNRSEMLNVAVRDYVEKNEKPEKKASGRKERSDG